MLRIFKTPNTSVSPSATMNSHDASIKPSTMMVSTRFIGNRFSLSPLAAGESHMDLRSLLPWSARWILKTTPAWRRESDGEIQEDFSTVAGPAGRQCAARSGGGAGHRLGGDAVRGRDLLGHGRVRASQ